MKSQQQPLLESDPSVRRAFDYYPTPAWMTRALLRRMPALTFSQVLEPCAGDGAIVGVLREAGAIVDTNDLDPSRETDWHLDATRDESWASFRSPTWTITNVPFNLADQIVPLAVKHSRRGVATILRLSWLEPTADRADFLKEHPPDRLLVLPRHDFKGRGSTDSVTSAWFIWDHARHLAPQGIEIVTKAERDELISLARETQDS